MFFYIHTYILVVPSFFGLVVLLYIGMAWMLRKSFLFWGICCGTFLCSLYVTGIPSWRNISIFRACGAMGLLFCYLFCKQITHQALMQTSTWQYERKIIVQNPNKYKFQCLAVMIMGQFGLKFVDNLHRRYTTKYSKK